LEFGAGAQAPVVPIDDDGQIIQGSRHLD